MRDRSYVLHIAEVFETKMAKGWSLHFLTLHLNRIGANIIGSHGGIIAGTSFDQFVGRFYRTLMGSHYERKHKWLPVIAACLDLPWTREFRTRGLPSKSLRGLHFHCIIAVPPRTKRGVRESIETAAQTSRFTSPYLTEILDLQSLTKILSYCFKLIDRFPRDHGGTESLWTVHPKSWLELNSKIARSSRVVKRKNENKQCTLMDYPKELRGLPQNKWGGHRTKRLRTYGRKDGCS